MPTRLAPTLTYAQINQISNKLATSDKVVVSFNGGRLKNKFLVHSVKSYLSRAKQGRRIGKAVHARGFSKKA